MVYIMPNRARHAPGRKFRKRDMVYRNSWWVGKKWIEMKWNAWNEWIDMNIISPLRFTPRGRGHHFVVIKRWVLEKTYKMIGFQGFFVPTKWWGRVHQPPLFNTPPFCTEIYLARMFDLDFFLSMNFACMLGPCAPKRHHFVRTCSLPFAIVFLKCHEGATHPFCKEMGSMICPVFFGNAEEKWSVHIPVFLA